MCTVLLRQIAVFTAAIYPGFTTICEPVVKSGINFKLRV
jgi:hypothetical protein